MIGRLLAGARLTPALEAETSTAPELRVVHARLLGWLEGICDPRQSERTECQWLSDPILPGSARTGDQPIS